jgi:DNA-binding GntR family transcriptional regulator
MATLYEANRERKPKQRVNLTPSSRAVSHAGSPPAIALPLARPYNPITEIFPSLLVQAPARPLSNRNSSDLVAEAIAVGILKRRYVVGQRLVEADLMEELGVGRSTVREALKTLAGTGVVELIPHRGAVIRALNRRDAEELLQVLEVLCGLAARLAALRIEIGDNSKRFQAVTEALLSAGDSDRPMKMLDLRARFYQVIFDIAGSNELSRVVPSARAHLFRTQMYEGSTYSDLKAMAAEYRAITEAILEGDAKKAEQRMKQHMLSTGRRTLSRFPDQ